MLLTFRHTALSRIFGGLAASIFSAALCHAFAAEYVARPGEDHAAVLRNPDMGWVLYENYPVDTDVRGSSTLLSLPGETFPEAAAVALMFSWADVEKSEGVFDFSRVDHAYDYWRARGKEVQLRLSSESLVWWNTRQPPSGLGVPRHLLERLPTGSRQTRQMEGVAYEVVDSREPLYLEHLARFLSAVAEHFSAKRPVTLVDLRGFGVWGEWHSGFQYQSPAHRRAALMKVIDVYASAFPKHWLSLSYSHDPDGPKELYAGPNDRFDEASTRTYAEFLRFSAFDHALTKPNITFRRDGAGGAVFSNQRRLNEEAFRTLNKGPMMSEFLGGYGAVKKGGQRWIEWMIDDALSLHPNYINLLGWQGADALAFIREQPELVAKGAREMGYRLVPRELRYSRSIRTEEAFPIEMQWLNRGAGRAMRPYDLSFAVLDDAGEVVATSTVEPVPCDRWIKGESYDVRRHVTFRQVPPGAYSLALRLADPLSGSTIALPLKEPRKDGWSTIGKIEITPGGQP